MDEFRFTEKQAEIADSIITKTADHFKTAGNYGYAIRDHVIMKSLAVQKESVNAKIVIVPFDQEMIGLSLYINDVTEYIEGINCAALDSIFFERIMAGCLFTMIRMGIRYEEACLF